MYIHIMFHGFTVVTVVHVLVLHICTIKTMTISQDFPGIP